MQQENMLENLDFCHHLTENRSNENMGEYGFDIPAIKSFCSSSFYSQAVKFQETVESITTPEARAIAASKNHKEAERRRRERINSHLDKLRTLLSCNSKTDKASLLAKVVQRVRELKQQTSEIMQLDETNFPSETDEITVLSSNDCLADGRLLIKASLCCEDRFDLIPDLIETLKSLGLSPLRAEMVTLGGRIRNVIVLAVDKDHSSDESLLFLRDALRSIIQPSSYGTGERSKRRRVLDQGTSNY
ncbi:PREDICTED: transcription factor bHLH106-like [Nicotiana attenuata]|uniref:Transcription factor bhlh106 n=1 Tax=Nicotiana attenuata TaxID=49451 RepID=A0A1J6IF90_NICAT|nr:PREDICTED: transcription factor bHLH106-like [Nicotiana attenuata]OIS97610.1 transcription factor bhlh106 [Nicotiana attenuata]